MMMDTEDTDLLNRLSHDAWSGDHPMPEERQRQLGELAVRAWQEIHGLREIAAGFAAIDPVPEGARCAACAGVAEPSEWSRWGGPPLDTGPPAPQMVFVPAAAARHYGWWHEPGCAWLAAWQRFGHHPDDR